jgi:hypothetical protein
MRRACGEQLSNKRTGLGSHMTSQQLQACVAEQPDALFRAKLRSAWSAGSEGLEGHRWGHAGGACWGDQGWTTHTTHDGFS